MKRYVFYKVTLLICLLSLTNISKSQVRILTIGDSTMADYDEEKNSGENEMRGWAQMLPMFFSHDVAIDNAAKNGRSSKSFYFEFWNTLKQTLKPGDYVFIQFGHNDEKAKGLDTPLTDTKERGTAAWGQYQIFLTNYVTESREKGAIPIFFTPVVRRAFNDGGKINNTGLHNLSEYCGNDSAMNYPLAMRDLAMKLSVPLVDMTMLTKQLVEDYGAEKSKQVIYVNKDNTHLKAMGGILFSRLAVQDLQRQKILSDCIDLHSGLSIIPPQSNFEKQFAGKSTTKTFTLIGLDIQPRYGNITIESKAPFYVSNSISDVQKHSTSLQIPYESENINQPIYITFSPTEEKHYSSVLTLLCNDKKIQDVNLEGYSISLKGAAQAKIEWKDTDKIIKKAKGLEATLGTSNLQALPMNGKTVLTTPDKIWPSGDIDVNTSRYMEYKITSKTGVLYIDSIAFDIKSLNDKDMYFTALGSTDATFSNPVTLATMVKLSTEAQSFHSKTFVEVPKGKTFYLRFYPWTKSAATDCYFELNNISVEGKFFK